MAVYTKIDRKTLEKFLKNYNLGKLISYEEIQEGIENTNYKLTISSGKYNLTIFEKRVKKSDLPFFVELKKHLFKKKILCPMPISNKKGKYINKIKNKSCLINTWLNGKKTKIINIIHCKELGKNIALMHLKTNDFKLTRKNSLGKNSWKNLFAKFKNKQQSKNKNLYRKIKIELDYLKSNWPINLPTGIIHADAFNDNIFFKRNNFSGIIDFYFSCKDYYAYDLAICINAWCFNSKYQLEVKKANALLQSYQKYRKLLLKEKNALPILLRGAAMRFLLTRVYDSIYQNKEAIVKSKDPMEYFKIMSFHKNNNILNQIKF